MARKPPLVSEEAASRFVEALKAGNEHSVALDYAGILEADYLAWIGSGDRRSVQLLQDAERARSLAVVRNNEAIQRAAANGSWQAAAWFLDRARAGETGSPVSEVAAKGDRRATLESIRANLARRLDDPAAKDAASLARQLVVVLAELESLPTAEVSPRDEIAKRRADRLAASADRARSSGSG